MDTIQCTECGSQIEMTKALSERLEKQMKEKYTKEFAVKEQALLKEKQELEASQKNFAEDMEKKLEQEKIKLWKVAQEKAQEKVKGEMDTKLKDLEEQNKEREKRLEKMQQEELALRKEKRLLEEKAKHAEVEMQRKLDAEKKQLEETMKKSQELYEKELQIKLEEEAKRKMMEKDQQVLQLKKTIDELKRKSEQGSMQLQGDAQEEDLKASLSMAFPMDVLEDVATGIRGADLVHQVNTVSGQNAGTILWESKSTKAWNKEWVKKLKDDQAQAKADICILTTTAMPEGITSFGEIDGVWVVAYNYAIAFAHMMRRTLLEVHRVKSSFEGRDEKMQILYDYLSGAQFKNRVESIVSAFSTMKEDLDAEKRAFQKHWARREKQIERVVTNTSGMYGDLEGIIGGQLPHIDYFALELPGDEEDIDKE